MGTTATHRAPSARMRGRFTSARPMGSFQEAVLHRISSCTRTTGPSCTQEPSYVAHSPLKGRQVDVAATVFVDDTADRVAARMAPTLARRAEASQEALRATAQDTGMALNDEKRQVLLDLVGAGPVQTGRQLLQCSPAQLKVLHGRVTAARYLRPQVHYRSAFAT